MKVQIQDTTNYHETEDDPEFNVNGTVKFTGTDIVKAIERELKIKYEELLRAFPSLKVTLLECDAHDGFVDFCVEAEDEQVNKEAIAWWHRHQEEAEDEIQSGVCLP